MCVYPFGVTADALLACRRLQTSNPYYPHYADYTDYADYTYRTSAKPIELSLSTMFPAGTAQEAQLEAWADKIKADSKGRLTVCIFPGATLASAADTYPATAKGVCDIGASFRYTLAGFDLGNAIRTFMSGVPDAATTSRVWRDVYNEFPEFKKEWE